MTLSSRHRSSCCVRRSALPGALAAITACFAAPAISHASPITYELSGATATFTSPIGTLTLTGDFVFDPVTSTFDSVSITATGPTTILDTSPETFDVVLLGGMRFLDARDTGPVPPVTIALRFVDAVGGLSPNPIDGFDIGNSINVTATAVTGDAIPLPVLEPSTWALLLVGFAGLGFAGYRQSASGEVLTGDQCAARSGDWLPNDDDMAFIGSLMKPSHEPGKYASWIARRASASTTSRAISNM